MSKFANKLILVINGPNLNLLGRRSPEIYGEKKLDDLENELTKHYSEKGIDLKFFQTNNEGEIIDKIHEADYIRYDTGEDLCLGIVLNPGAFAHYSYSIRDAIEAIQTDVIEVHISDVYNREDFRKIMLLSDVCKKTIVGRGIKGYYDAIDYLLS